MLQRLEGRDLRLAGTREVARSYADDSQLMMSPEGATLQAMKTALRYKLRQVRKADDGRDEGAVSTYALPSGQQRRYLRQD